MDLSGIIPPVPTPFSADAIDMDGFRLNLERLMGWEGMPAMDGTEPLRLSGLLVAGSNGEAPLMSQVEINRLVEVARSVVPADRLLLVGTGRESTAAAIHAARCAEERGANAVLVGTPSYFRHQITPGDLVDHFNAVAAALSIPVIIYSVPRFTGFEIPVAVVNRLASNPAVAGIKDSSLDTSRIVEILAGDHPVEGDGFRVMAGNATVLYPALACGAAGAILAVASLVPGLACALLAAWSANDQDAARRIQKRMTPLARAVTVEHGIAGLKAAMDIIGLTGGDPRRPLKPLAPVHRTALRGVLEHALWAEGQELSSGSRLADSLPK